MGLILYFMLFVVALKILNKCWCFWSRSKVCLIGKTAIVTGGASGIGYQTVLDLAAKGCRIIIADVVVNLSEVVEKVIDETHNKNIIGKKVDLRSFKSVREFAKDVFETEDRLDILICNAGIGSYVQEDLTEDGLQSTMQVNYFSHFLLTHLLLDLLKKSSPSRIIFTSSLAAYFSDLTINKLNNVTDDYLCRYTTKFTGGCYSNSKLALAAAAKTFGQKLQGTGVTANVVHPSGVKTGIFLRTFQKDRYPLVVLLAVGVYLFGKNMEEGAQTLIHLAQSDSVKYTTGQSFYEGMIVPRPFQLYRKNFCEEIWEKSIKFTNLEPHEIKC